MATTGTNLVTIKARLITVLRARSGLSGVAVNYGPPRHAEDLTATDGDLRAIWLTTASGQVEIPYSMGPTSKPTRERLSIGVSCQAIERGEDGTTDGQQAADTAVVALFSEVSSALAADPSLGLAAPRPLAIEVDGWLYNALPPEANACGARIDVTLSAETQIAAPS